MAGHEFSALGQQGLRRGDRCGRGETDPVKRAALYIKANDIMWQDTVFIPVMHRLKVEAAANTLRPVVSGWANETDNLFDWYREATRMSARRDFSLMSQYVLRRLLIAVPSLLGISLVLFIVLALAPGDPFIGTGDQSRTCRPKSPPRFGPSSASTIRSTSATCTGSPPCCTATGAFPSSAG